VHSQFTDAIEGGIGLIGVEDVNAAHIERQLSETAEVEVALDTEFDIEAVGDDAEVVVVALHGPLSIGTQAETVGQLEVVVPEERDVWGVPLGHDCAASCGCSSS